MRVVGIVENFTSEEKIGNWNSLCASYSEVRSLDS